MMTERRCERSQVPARPSEVLNELQLLTLKNMERFGWSLAFIRKPLFQESVPVLRHSDSRKFGTIDTDGRLNAHPDINFR
jgi:hypothetical protein